jgi:hypothetical protein
MIVMVLRRRLPPPAPSLYYERIEDVKNLISMAALAAVLPMAALAAPTGDPLVCKVKTITKSSREISAEGMGSVVEIFDRGTSLLVRIDGLNPPVDFTVTARNAKLTVAQVVEAPGPTHLTIVDRAVAMITVDNGEGPIILKTDCR